jgi:predicted RNA-binding Zn ribbon-like protein
MQRLDIEDPARPGLEDTIDFINTLEHSRHGDREHLPTAAAAIAWLVERGLLDGATVAARPEPTTAEPPADEQDASILARIHRARAALRAVVDAIVERRPPDPVAVAEVNRLLAGGPAPILVPVADGVGVAERARADPIDAALGRLAEPLVGLLERGERDRLRTCADATCRWVFYDASRAGRRRWCDMATCGNRAKAARHRARQGTQPAGARPA